MKTKVTWMFILTLLAGTLGACGSSNGMAATAQVQESTTVVEAMETGQTQREEPVARLAKCGEVYADQALSYNIIGVRTKAYEDGTKHLILNMEVYNHSGLDVNFTPMDRLALFNANNEECSLNVLATVNVVLAGMITPENKIMGEAVFEINDMETDVYTLHVGEFFEYAPAIEITTADIGLMFAEKFVSNGVQSAYTIGVPVESAQFDMLINSASVKPCDKEGKEILLINMSITNNDSEARSLALQLAGVYTAEGEHLSTEGREWTFTNYPIESGSTETGIVSFYIPEGTKDFYMTVAPDLNKFAEKKNIVFSVE